MILDDFWTFLDFSKRNNKTIGKRNKRKMINNGKQKNMGMGWGLRSKLVKMDHSIEYGRQNEEQNNRDALNRLGTISQ